MTRVSIVTISYNQAKYLERTILSVLGQDYPDIEYIVVDPGSTDGSRDIIDSYRSRISKIIYRPDRGPADGLNRGFEKATGEIFGFLNSDDLLQPGAVSSVAKYMDMHSDVDVVSGHCNLIGSDDRFLRRLYSDRMTINRCIYGGVILLQQSTFFRRGIYEKVGGFCSENTMCWDAELYLDMARAGGKFAIVNEFWSAFRIYSQSITGEKTNTAIDHQTRAEMFLRATGRQFQACDALLVHFYRLLRHVLNPLDTWETIRRGPVFGRSYED
jgi:glycosyltransferase involved in cell wall biosynthesis